MKSIQRPETTFKLLTGHSLPGTDGHLWHPVSA